MLIDKWSEYNCYRITQKVMAWWAMPTLQIDISRKDSETLIY